MRKDTLNLIESIQANLNEKINKDNIEINKAIANANRGTKNAQKVRDAGYEIDNDYGSTSIRNPKTNKSVDIGYDITKDNKDKVDWKGKLDSDRKKIYKTSIRPEYAGKGKEIPNNVVLKKDKYGNKIVSSDDYDAYSSHTSMANPEPNYKSISKNINDYKKSVSDRDENRNSVEYYKNSGRKYYTDRVDKAQKELDWQDSHYADKENKANKAEEKRKEIIANAKAKHSKANESEELKESVDIETAVVGSYNHLVNDIDKPTTIEAIYDDVINNYDLDDTAKDLLGVDNSEMPYEKVKRTIASILDEHNLSYTEDDTEFLGTSELNNKIRNATTNVDTLVSNGLIVSVQLIDPDKVINRDNLDSRLFNADNDPVTMRSQNEYNQAVKYAGKDNIYTYVGFDNNSDTPVYCVESHELVKPDNNGSWSIEPVDDNVNIYNILKKIK